MPTWKELCEDPKFNDLPYKVELNAVGQIIMSPVRNIHGHYQSEIAALLRERLPNGKVMVECGVETSDNVKVADVAWVSNEKWKVLRDRFSCSVAPEICVEVWSPSNTRRELDWKRQLFVTAGADEFWYCDKDGKLAFFDGSGEIAQSKLCPGFPRSVE